MRSFLVLAALFPLLAGCGDSAPRTVLLVTVDTLRADHCSTFGYDLETTPNLTKLADRGAAFDRGWTQHVETVPSLASTMTSRYPREIGVRKNGDLLPREFPTLAESMKRAGYETAAFVSVHLLKPEWCRLERGFDVYDHRMTAPNFDHDRAERRADDTVRAALEWLRKNEGRRRFLWVHLYDPHGRYEHHDITSRFVRDGLVLRRLDPAQIVSYQRYGDSLDPDDYITRYDGEIFVADRALGALYDALGEDALVVFHSDHGESLGEDNYWFRHSSLLNLASIHVPIVIVGKNFPAGTRRTFDARNLDLAPTILDVCGLPPLPDARGRSLVTPPPERVASFAEALRRGSPPDRTGVDMRYKVSATSGDSHVVHWPGTEPCPSPLLREWLETTRDRLEDGRHDPELEQALRGLGY